MTTALFKNIRPHILTEIASAELEIKAAIGWFTNQDLFEALCQKVREGVSVELIILNDYINNRVDGLDFQYFIDIGGAFYFGDDDRPMHNKCCIIDKRILINGSYNWTYYAEIKNEENTIIHGDNQSLIDDFIQNFNRIRDGLPKVKKVIKRTFADIYQFDAKYYLAQDYLYSGIHKQNSFIVDKAIKLLPDDLEIQKTAFNSKLRRRKTTLPVIEEIKDDRSIILVPVGTEIPAKGESSFTTSFDNQESADITIKFGHDEKASKNKLIGKFNISKIPKMKQGEAKLITKWEIDIYGKITIIETILSTGHSDSRTFDINHLLELVTDEPD